MAGGEDAKPLRGILKRAIERKKIQQRMTLRAASLREYEQKMAKSVRCVARPDTRVPHTTHGTTRHTTRHTTHGCWRVLTCAGRWDLTEAQQVKESERERIEQEKNDLERRARDDRSSLVKLVLEIQRRELEDRKHLEEKRKQERQKVRTLLATVRRTRRALV
jgi:hypothetical protein